MLNDQQAVLLIKAPVNAGVTATLTAFFAKHDLFIHRLEQYVDGEEALMRFEWMRSDIWPDKSACIAALQHELGVSGFDPFYSVKFGNDVPSVGLLCSDQLHVLDAVLKRLDTGHYPELKVPFIISDNQAAGEVADSFGVPFFHIPLTKPVAEIQRRQLEIIDRYQPDILGLARYDALLAQAVIDRSKCTILSVHNSFLPPIKSEKAYSLAHEQGLKLIGATARFVKTKALGPIVQQDVAMLEPAASVKHVVLKGQAIEQKVFLAALRKLAEHKVMVYNAKTIVFD